MQELRKLYKDSLLNSESESENDEESVFLKP
jgi:hypothetical protein